MAIRHKTTNEGGIDMRKITMLGFIILLISSVTSVFASSDTSTEEITKEFKELTRSTDWREVQKLPLNFNVHHPQGMTKVNDLYYISSVEIIEKPEKYETNNHDYDRTAGKGQGHLFIVDEDGKLIKDIVLGEGDMYHPGGIAFDGEFIWVPVAEYRPDSQSIIYKVDPATGNATKQFEADDHIGGIVKDVHKNTLYGVNWGSRQFYEFNKDGKVKSVEDNDSHFIDYQDCEGVDKNNILCTGLSELSNSKGDSYELGGMALLDRKTMEIQHEVPMTNFSPQGHTITRNPVFVEKTTEGLKVYALPDDDYASLLIYETHRNEEL